VFEHLGTVKTSSSAFDEWYRRTSASIRPIKSKSKETITDVAVKKLEDHFHMKVDTALLTEVEKERIKQSARSIEEKVIHSSTHHDRNPARYTYGMKGWTELKDRPVKERPECSIRARIAQEYEAGTINPDGNHTHKRNATSDIDPRPIDVSKASTVGSTDTEAVTVAWGEDIGMDTVMREMHVVYDDIPREVVHEGTLEEYAVYEDLQEEVMPKDNLSACEGRRKPLWGSIKV
jgi:hypothetical protein